MNCGSLFATGKVSYVEEVEVQTETLSIKATPMANGYVKAKTGDDTTDAVYQNWYSAVYLPPDESALEPANG